MIMRFCFSSTSNNQILQNILQNILHKIIHKYEILGVIEELEFEVNLYLHANELVLQECFAYLNLPKSLFYYLKNVQVVTSMPTQKPLKSSDCFVAFTQDLIDEVNDENSKNYFNPFIKNNFDKNINDSLVLNFTQNEKNQNLSYKEKITQAALHVKQNNTLNITTKTGLMSVKAISKNTKDELLDKQIIIIACDFSVVQKMFVVSDEQLQALVAIERPVLNLKLNLIFQNSHNLPIDYADVKLPDSMLLYLFCKQLFANGVEFIYLYKPNEQDVKTLSYEQKFLHNDYKIQVLKNGEYLFLDDNEYLYKKQFPAFLNISHKRYTMLMYEHKLLDEISACFYLSEKFDDQVMMYSQKNGLIELVKIEFENGIEQIISSIKQTENGEKLLYNYEKNYSLEDIKNIKFDTNLPKSFFTLLGIVGIFLGFDKNVQKSAKKLLQNAKNCNFTKGPRLDVKMKNNSFCDTINVEKFIQSGLSFKLAGVSDELISLGYLQSIAYFVSDTSDIIAKEFNAKHICLCGSMFGYSNLLELSASNIAPNHKVCINKIFSIDE